MSLLMLATLALPTGALGLLFQVAIACICIWGIIALVRWAGWVIPEPVRIIFMCLVAILLIIWLFKLFGMLT